MCENYIAKKKRKKIENQKPTIKLTTNECIYNFYINNLQKQKHTTFPDWLRPKCSKCVVDLHIL